MDGSSCHNNFGIESVCHKEFDEALEEYNKKQTRQDRKIEDYFEYVAGKE